MKSIFTFDDLAEEEARERKEEEGEDDLFECVACRKVFKSETALLNHKNILIVESWVLHGRESKARAGGEEAERGNDGGRPVHAEYRE